MGHRKICAKISVDEIVEIAKELFSDDGCYCEEPGIPPKFPDWCKKKLSKK